MSNNLGKEEIITRLQAIPEKPGVYLMKDKHGKVIYVGKAKVLRNRVRSYFSSKHLPEKIREMVPQIHDIDYIVTDSEHEALTLEVTLIKHHMPKYNSMFKDDKRLPYIKVTVQEEFPRVLKCRQIINDGSKYYGPYTALGSAAEAIKLIHQHFMLCHKENEPIDGKQARPCLPYYLHRCLGACAGRADPQEYRAATEQVILFLEGKHDELTEKLRRKMEEAAENLEFEKAALYRNQIKAIEDIRQRQKVVLPTNEDMDIISIAIDGGEAGIERLFIRDGRLVGHDHSVVELIEDQSPGQIIQIALEQFYIGAYNVPGRIVLQYPPDEIELIRSALQDYHKREILLEVPTKGEKLELVNMAAQNAKEGLERKRFKWLSEEQKRTGAMLELQKELQLPTKPTRIECYDISNVQGADAVGSMVVFEDGAPARNQYRRFRIKGVEGPNDFEMMREVLTRRFKRAISDDYKETSWGKLPDLIIIDGGKGQLGVAVEVLQSFGLGNVPVFGLAKQQEELFKPGRSESIMLPRDSEALYLLQRIRDEAHRFALGYHRSLHNKKSVGSILDQVPGIGPKRKKALIQAFGSVSKIREASIDEIMAAVKGIDRATVIRLKEAL